MLGAITNRETMLGAQGDRVLVLKAVEGKLTERVLTFVHVIDAGDARSLRLVNKDAKVKQPDWLVSDKMFAAIKPARANKVNAKWELLVK